MVRVTVDAELVREDGEDRDAAQAVERRDGAPERGPERLVGGRRRGRSGARHGRPCHRRSQGIACSFDQQQARLAASLERLRGAWEQLLERSAGQRPSLTPTWTL